MNAEARELAIALVSQQRRAAFRAILALDERLGAIVRSTSEPLIGRMRLAWWREALERLDIAPAAGEPLLAELQRSSLAMDVCGADVASLTEGWEALLIGDLDEAVLSLIAEKRGAVLFLIAARLLGTDPIADVGEGWALANLATHVRDPDAACRARSLAADHLNRAFRQRFPPRARPLGVMALLAAWEMRGGRQPFRDAIRLVGFRLTGRHRLEIGSS